MRKPVVCLVLALLATGCGTTPLQPRQETGTDLISRYFDNFNRAGDQGPEEQQRFLEDARHPDFTGQECELGDLTMDIYPAMSTVRPDPDWSPDGEDPPRGEVFVVAVSLTVRRAGAAIGEQIGSQRVVLLDRRVYGFAPCPKS
ncbi:hypothetical protein [Amycolatopsis magusensis]|uniref:Lipoprotein n=1 Tax=Amycolatopsis magusensis TaxID=882444 RepID=A0ABS4PKY2_9PSEU|nr:hypothetical protein [Amycolatopsis magusensis]MBP2180094.1 hypothetical protein [Amycolatopsis magusensis]MDI5977136.1 hypothetical protein [Amycolatopsis magusensis]